MCLWRDPGAENWRPVKNGEQASGDTSSLSSVGLKEFKKEKKSMCAGGLFSWKRGRGRNAYQGSPRSAGLDGGSMAGRRRGQSVRILDRKK